MRDYMAVYKQWLESDFFDSKTREELKNIANDDNEIKERFYMDLKFGTAGLRGIMGAGTNRMNNYVIMKSTQGLANYINKQNIEKPAVAIAYDSRNNSQSFAEVAALTLCENNIKAYIFDSLRPTPVLSYAVRQLNCIAGINITASHNPPEYNGYKVYWADGAQITPPHDTGIMDEVNAITDYSVLKCADKKEAMEKGLYEIIGSELDDKYIEEIKSLVRHPEIVKKQGPSLKIVYSPLHGTGNLPVRRVLKELGFTDVHVVPSQELPDGNFPTVSYPNPETDEAFAEGLKLAEEIGADIILATDPDADRLGIRVRDKEGKFQTFTGNMSGCLVAEYEVSSMKELGMLKEDSYMIKSIVSSNMADAIAEYYNIEMYSVLTGFKYIGLEMLKKEKAGKGHYVFGFEESYGCLIGDYARDKDAVSASMALCEAAAYYKSKGKNLWDVMLELYEKYGYFVEDTVSITLKGIDGQEEIRKIMDKLHNTKVDKLGDFSVLEIIDYKKNIRFINETGEEGPTGLPESDVIYYKLNDNSWCCVRPSGTEPKIKLYVGARGNSKEDAYKKSENLKADLKTLAGV